MHNKKINNKVNKNLDIRHDKHTISAQHIKEQQWLKENKEAIDEHNKLVEKYGCFSDAYRRF